MRLYSLPRPLRSAALLSFLCVFTGCTVQPAPVKGSVKLDGKPLPFAYIRLTPEEPSGKEASATSGADGIFQLSTFKGNDGAFPGAYKITVQWSEPVKIRAGLSSPVEIQQATLEAELSREPSVVLPAIYTQLDRTVLKHRVPEDGDIKLELASERR
jgi:hypothetical protein